MVETDEQGTPLANIRKAGWLLAVVGATFVILAIAVPAAHQFDLQTKTGRTTGTVVDQVLNSRDGRHLNLEPVIEFRTAQGSLQRFQPPQSWPGVADQTGQEVPVAYDPAKPSNATINDLRDVLYPFFLFFVVGLFCLLGGTWVLTRFAASGESAAGVAA